MKTAWLSLIALILGTARLATADSSNLIQYERCGTPNTKTTICLARTDAGSAYIVTLNPGQGPGFIRVTETATQMSDRVILDFTGITPLKAADGKIYEHVVDFKVVTLDKSPEQSKGSLMIDGKMHYKNFVLWTEEGHSGP